MKFYGKLQKWNPRGFTFIGDRDDNGPNVFCHASELEKAKIETDTGILGLAVNFQIATRGDGKSYAIDIET